MCWQSSGSPLSSPAQSDGNQLLGYKLLCGETGMAGNWYLWPKANEDLRCASSHMSDLGTGFSPKLRHEVAATPANTLIIASVSPNTRVTQLSYAQISDPQKLK